MPFGRRICEILNLQELDFLALMLVFKAHLFSQGCVWWWDCLGWRVIQLSYHLLINVLFGYTHREVVEWYTVLARWEKSKMVSPLLCYDTEGESFLSFENYKFSHSESKDQMTQSLNLQSSHEADFQSSSGFSAKL